MKRFSITFLVALALLVTQLAFSVSAQDATPVASPVAETSEDDLAPVVTTEVDGVTTFTLIERPVSDTVVDQGPIGDSLGDWLVFSNALFDESNTMLVGVDQGYCLRARPLIGVWECTWSAILANGTIVVQGPFYDNRDTSLLAVTGGTGDFANARGQMELTTTLVGNFQFTYELTL